MNRRCFSVASVVLLVFGIATCQLGYRYELGKIPAERRARMHDTDWVGAEWIGVGGTMFVLGAIGMITGIWAEGRNQAK
jgi:hypothetical protein